MGAMMQMKKIDIATLEAAYAGEPALIPLYENATPFTFRMIDGDHPENGAELAAFSPMGKFPLRLAIDQQGELAHRRECGQLPLLIDGETRVFE
eukprot:gene57558-78860_t